MAISYCVRCNRDIPGTEKRGAAFLLSGSTVAAAKMFRFRGMFACVLVVVGGGILSEAVAVLLDIGRRKGKTRTARAMSAVAMCLSVCFVSAVGIRIHDLVSNRYYMNNLPFEFGTGLSWWYPERAMAFIEREHLPGNVFSSLVLGGYQVWRLPQYPDYIDGRGRPFSGEIFDAHLDLSLNGPESTVWRQEANKWRIDAIIALTGRVSGIEFFPKLRQFCESQTWRPVYLDEVSAVFVRRSPETQALIAGSEIRHLY